LRFFNQVVSMDWADDFAPELFGLWPARRGGLSEAEAQVADEEYFLETKSAAASPAEEQRVLLNQMTAELREQFSAFRGLRRAAEAAADSGDEAAAKLARADLKAATDAMSLIVRTLEKIDQLQRQLARDLEMEAERQGGAAGYEAAKAELLRLIEERAAEKAETLLAEERLRWKEANDGTVLAGAGPPFAEDVEAEGGKAGPRDGRGEEQGA
jgi:hypothetical protein